MSGCGESNSVCLVPNQMYYRYTTPRLTKTKPRTHAEPHSCYPTSFSDLENIREFEGDIGHAPSHRAREATQGWHLSEIPLPSRYLPYTIHSFGRLFES